MPSQGEGEQSTKSGGPCPYAAHPTLFCRLVNEFASCPAPLPPPLLPPPPLPLPLPPLLPLPLPALCEFTTSCNDCCFERPLASETETVKPKLPAAAGIPENVPLVAPRTTPDGNSPEGAAKRYGAVPPVTVSVLWYAVPTVAEGSVFEIVSTAELVFCDGAGDAVETPAHAVSHRRLATRAATARRRRSFHARAMTTCPGAVG